MKDKILEIPVNQLLIQDQKHRTKLHISSLMESIESIGQLNPILVKKEGSKYRVVAGRRRTAALQTMQAISGEKTNAKIIVLDTDKLTEELITIDENIMREDLSPVEFDEALYRRKQIYEEIHPETKKHTAGGFARHSKSSGEKKTSKPFTADAATKLKLSRRTVEKSIARASKASPMVKKARADGSLAPSKVDLLVGLTEKEQDLLLPLVTKKDFKESRALVERAKKIGAKATAMYFEEEQGSVEEPKDLKMIVRETMRLNELVQDALKARQVFRSKIRFDHVRSLEALAMTLEKFTDYQRAALGEVRTIRRRGSEQRAVRA